MDEAAASCRICGAGQPRRFRAREMMYGLRESFDYLECAACGCVQIAAYPANVAAYYPPHYHGPPDRPAASGAGIKTGIKAAALGLPGLWKRWLDLPSTRAYLADKPVAALYPRLVTDRDARILDIGCGTGLLLRHLIALGYRRVLGADPFIDGDIGYHGRLLVKKVHLHALTGRYDCISLHHALEHMPDQPGVFARLRDLLAPGGILLIRIPLVGGEAWRTYGANWVQLDPPRHFYLHSQASLRLLAARAGLAVRSIIWDSTGFQFWGSELYCRDIPLFSDSVPPTSNRALFSAAELQDFDRRAARLNEVGDGDQIVAVLGLDRSLD